MLMIKKTEISLGILYRAFWLYAFVTFFYFVTILVYCIVLIQNWLYIFYLWSIIQSFDGLIWYIVMLIHVHIHWSVLAALVIGIINPGRIKIDSWWLWILSLQEEVIRSSRFDEFWRWRDLKINRWSEDVPWNYLKRQKIGQITVYFSSIKEIVKNLSLHIFQVIFNTSFV